MKHRHARQPLLAWLQIVESVTWRRPRDVISTWGSANPLRSDQNLCVFNIKGNTYRLIAAIDYPNELAVVRDVLTHADYDREA